MLGEAQWDGAGTAPVGGGAADSVLGSLQCGCPVPLRAQPLEGAA